MTAWYVYMVGVFALLLLGCWRVDAWERQDRKRASKAARDLRIAQLERELGIGEPEPVRAAFSDFASERARIESRFRTVADQKRAAAILADLAAEAEKARLARDYLYMKMLLRDAA